MNTENLTNREKMLYGVAKSTELMPGEAELLMKITGEVMIQEKYNGWTNRETWLVNLWYGDALVDLVEENGSPIDENEAEEWVRYVAEECEVLSQPPVNGLLSDFLEQCWREVDWNDIAQSVNDAAEVNE